MLSAVLRLLVRSLVDLALVCLLAAGLLLAVAWKCTRRIVTGEPSRLERGGLGVAQALRLAAGAADLIEQRARVESSAPEELEELELEPTDWRRMVI